MHDGNITFMYIHAIWCTSGRKRILSQAVRKVFFAFMQKSPEQKGIQIIAVNGDEDHVHCLFKLMPVQSVSAVIQQLKIDSTDWLNNNRFLSEPFEWNDGFTAFSVSPSTIDKAVDYINRQELYHREKTLTEELEAFNKMVVQTN